MSPNSDRSHSHYNAPRAEVPSAVALNSLAFNLARTAGPAIGGVIVAKAGPPAAFLINGLSYFALIIVLVLGAGQDRPVSAAGSED
jgi:predicted MFS family arabinose efflux permease